MALTATVTPGYTFVAGEELTPEKLNSAASPTIEVSGTLTGSAGVQVDGVSIEVGESGLTIKQVLAGKLDAGYAARNYAAGTLGQEVDGKYRYAVTLSPAATAVTAGMVIQFKADVAWLAPAAVVYVKLNALGVVPLRLIGGGNLHRGAIQAGQVVVAVYDGVNFVVLGPFWPQFDSGLIALSANVNTMARAHSLGGVPTRVRWVLECTAPDAGYDPGNQVDVSAVMSWYSSYLYPAVTPITTEGGVTLRLVSTTDLRLARKDTGAVTVIAASKWAARCYASL